MEEIFHSQTETICQQPQLKSTLIVVGRSGHGKTTFTTMLATQRDDQSPFSNDPIYAYGSTSTQGLLKIQPGGKNGTKSCFLYQVHESHELLKQEKLFFIDTPGLNSKNSAFLITEQIDDLIREHQCVIIGIAYVIDISQKEEVHLKGDTMSYIGQLLRILKLRMSIKKSLMFYILNKWDRRYDQEQSNEIQFNIFKQIVQNQTGETNLKSIQWASKPILDFRNYTKFLRHQSGLGLQMVRSQWRELTNILRNLEQSNKMQIFKQYRDDYLEYSSEIVDVFKNQKLSKSFDKKICIFNVRVQKKQNSFKIKRIILPLATTAVLVPILPFIAMTTPIGICTCVGLAASSALVGFGLKRLFQNKKLQVINTNKTEDILLQQKLQKRLFICIERYLCNEFVEKIQTKNDYLYIPKQEWLLNGEVQQVYHKPFALFDTKSAESMKVKLPWLVNQTKKRLSFVCEVKYPKFEELESKMVQIIEVTYNNK